MKGVALRHRVQVMRLTLADDGFQQVETYAAIGLPLWAARHDVSDGERMRSGAVSAELMARFVVRRSEFADAITPQDRLQSGGVVFNIIGPPKLTGGDRMLEISVARRADL